VVWFSWTGVLGCGGLYTVFCGYAEAQKQQEPKEGRGEKDTTQALFSAGVVHFLYFW